MTRRRRMQAVSPEALRALDAFAAAHRAWLEVPELPHALRLAVPALQLVRTQDTIVLVARTAGLATAPAAVGTTRATSDGMSAPKFSKPQMAFLVNCAEYDPVAFDPYPFGGGRMSKIWASSWHRTCDSLVTRGYVERVRIGDHFGAKLTQAGRDWCFANGVF